MVKKFLRGINVSLLLLIIISTFSSCANEMNIFGENNNKQINFSVSVPEWMGTDSLATTKTSRATPITDNSFGTDKSFKLIADQNDGAGNYSTLINSQAVSYTNNIWKTSNDYYWSGTANKTISFYAYYPSTISNISHTAGSSPTLSYTVPDNVSDQIDIMTAINPNVSGSTATSTPLTFNHIFAAVKFAVGTSGLPSGTIKSITINGIKNSGTYTFGSGWALGSTISSFTVSPSATITGTSGENITSDIYTLMMIPQTFSNAIITLTYSNGVVFSTTISSGTWTSGNTYTYKLSKNIILNYEYTGSVQTFTAPYAGTYKIECWGASGGSANSSLAGRGGFTSGKIKLEKEKIIYVYVGGYGQTITTSDNTGTTLGGYNGGGTCVHSAAGGGGATDIRLVGGNWNDFSSLKSRIMVAGGGGGENNYGNNQIARGGCGGGLEGGSTQSRLFNISMFGATQTSGGITNQFPGGSYTKGYNGEFGIGGNSSSSFGGGGGGGYYGGAGGCNQPRSSSTSTDNGGEMPGSGGSSFISGYTGCNAISESSTFGNITHKNSPYHYSGYTFTDMQMISGTTTMISPTGTTETGHGGNGYARITFVSAN